ncbi:hypothetical protein HU200_019856 [Digitaria exilis]|uniref:protein-serine/threonine phosphatase n=1 Tax=Digitaria exilis TaxID=1010633 RepID=A0A835F2K9_9POAL|nr:hypothetical protein HU200_019856 [Digitaria exilis]
MLHGVRFLLSAAAAFARLAHALLRARLILFFMPLCSPTTTVAVPAPWQHLQPPARSSTTKVLHHPVVDDDGNKDQQPPTVVVPVIKQQQQKDGERGGAEKTTAKAAARGRPPRLAIPPPVACAPGVDPFGAAAERETDVATEVEVQGEGFCLASSRGVRHAMEDGYGVIIDNSIGGGRGSGSQQLVIKHILFIHLLRIDFALLFIKRSAYTYVQNPTFVSLFPGGTQAFYGVYDGHGGRAAVDFVADKLGKNVVAALAAASRRQQPPEPRKTSVSEEDATEEHDVDAVAAAIRAAYLTTDSEFLSQGARGGACAATAVVKGGDLYVANVGDCRAVLGSRGGVATALTSDHTAGREDERRRIESSGGYVSRGSSGVWRVQDCLAVSRAFGDASMKPWVTCDPEVTRRRITPDCRFLVVASDGLWNKVSCQEAVDAVVAGTTSSSSVGSCKELVALARSRGSRDDITVMVVDLQRFLQQ